MRVGRLWGVVAAGVLTAALVAAEGPAQGQGAKFPPGTALNVLVSASHQQFNPDWDALPQFEQQSGIRVTLTKIPTSDIRQRMMQDFQLGTSTFDNAEVPDDTLGAAQQYFTPLDPLLRHDGVDIVQWKKQFVPWAVQAATFGGEVKYWPFYAGTVAIAYRQDLFNDPKSRADFKAKFGYDFPFPPKTVAQFVDLAKFFTSGGRWGVVFPGAGETGENIMEQWIFESGLQYLDTKGHSMWGPAHPENIPIVARAAGILQDLVYKDKVAPPDVTGMTTSESSTFYESGKAAMLMDLIYLPWNAINQSNVTGRIGKSGSFEVPATKPGAGGIPFYWMRGVSQSSKHKDASYAFLKWLMPDDMQKLALTKGVGVYVPVKISLLDWAAQNNVVPVGVADGVKHAQFYRINAAVPRAREIVRKYNEQLMLNRITPQQFAQESGAEIEGLLKQMGYAK